MPVTLKEMHIFGIIWVYARKNISKYFIFISDMLRIEVDEAENQIH